MALASIVFALAAAAASHVTFDAGIARVQEFGTPHARPVILVPGLACGPWVWDRQIAALAPNHDVFVLTLPGFDGLPAIGGDRLMKRAVDSIHMLIAARHLSRPILVGHSLGGTLAVLFGETYPSDAANVVTVEGGYPVAPTQAARNAIVARSVAPYRGIPQARLSQALERNMLRYTITRKADVERAASLAGRSNPRAIVEWLKAALSLDLTPNLSRIRVPFTAIIPYDAQIDPYQGFASASAKLAAYRTWVGHARRGHVVLIRNSRHFVMIDQAALFERALEAAIAR